MFQAVSNTVVFRGAPTAVLAGSLAAGPKCVNLIANTATAKGLKIRAELDTGTYPIAG